MTGFIELCGAPGVGKTTLVAALAGRRVVTDGGAGAAILLPANRLTFVPRGLLRPLGSLLAGRAALAVLADRPRLARLTTRALSVEEVAARVPLSPGIVRDLLADIPAPGPDDPRADTAYRRDALGWLEDTLRTLQLAGALPDGVVALLDEGVVQRTVSLLGTTARDADGARLLARLPRPIAVVHLVAAPELIERRARARYDAGLTPRLHDGRDVEDVVDLALADASAIADVTAELERTGVRVIDMPVRAEEGADGLALRVLRAIDAAAGQDAAGQDAAGQDRGEAAGGPRD